MTYKKYTHLKPQLQVFVTDFNHQLVKFNINRNILNIVDLWGRYMCFLKGKRLMTFVSLFASVTEMTKKLGTKSEATK